MKIVMFAGGVGSRLWPLSRKNAPKQFEKIIGDKTMLQITVGKLFPTYGWDDVFISTGKQYAENVVAQLPDLPQDHVLVEPEMRDVGPAVGLVTSLFEKLSPDEPIALLWGSDHLVREEALFRDVLHSAESYIEKNPEKIVFVAQQPRFPNQNLGYIEFDEAKENVGEFPLHEFKSFLYRPHLSTAEKWVKDGRHGWNLGYFVTTPRFLWKLFQQFSPDLFAQLEEIQKSQGTPSYDQTLQRIYPTIEKISFDNAVLEKMDASYGRVISVDLGWSDIGAWEALKEALAGTETENVTKGEVAVEDCMDTLMYNFTSQLVVGIDLKDMIVVNTKDVVLICPKDSVPKIKKFVEKLRGTDLEHLT